MPAASGHNRWRRTFTRLHAGWLVGRNIFSWVSRLRRGTAATLQGIDVETQADECAATCIVVDVGWPAFFLFSRLRQGIAVGDARFFECLQGVWQACFFLSGLVAKWGVRRWRNIFALGCGEELLQFQVRHTCVRQGCGYTSSKDRNRPSNFVCDSSFVNLSYVVVPR